jgi:ABC-2 type transport system permease protein
MVLVGILVFKVPFRGSLGLLYLSMLVYLAALIGVGLFLSSLARTQQQAILYSFKFMVPAMLLSGFATPIENLFRLFGTASGQRQTAGRADTFQLG